MDWQTILWNAHTVEWGRRHILIFIVARRAEPVSKFIF